jgi:hypothetical protein
MTCAAPFSVGAVASVRRPTPRAPIGGFKHCRAAHGLPATTLPPTSAGHHSKPQKPEEIDRAARESRGSPSDDEVLVVGEKPGRLFWQGAGALVPKIWFARFAGFGICRVGRRGERGGDGGTWVDYRITPGALVCPPDLGAGNQKVWRMVGFLERVAPDPRACAPTREPGSLTRTPVRRRTSSSAFPRTGFRLEPPSRRTG